MSPGPTPGQQRASSELRLKTEYERARMEIARLKSDLDRGRTQIRKLQRAAVSSDPAAAEAEIAALKARVAELTSAHDAPVPIGPTGENLPRAATPWRRALALDGPTRSPEELDRLLARHTESIRSALGFGVVLLRIREPDTKRFRARAFAGPIGETSDPLAAANVDLEELTSLRREEFRISRSYLVPRDVVATRGPGVSGAGPDAELLVLLEDRDGEPLGYFIAGHPADGQTPSRATVEIFEAFADSVALALDALRSSGEAHRRWRDLEEAKASRGDLLALQNRLVATIAHEQRAPLTAVRAYLDTLLSLGDEVVPPQRLRMLLARMSEESRWLAWLNECLMDFARAESGGLRFERQRVNLAEVVEEVTSLLEHDARAGGVTLEIEPEVEESQVEADRQQMRQLVLQLGSNAIASTPAGGRVTFRIAGDAQRLVLRVEDTGAGIPPEALDKIFDRYYEVECAPVGRDVRAGTGLAICRAIVQWYGGEVFAESVLGQGSRFTVRLPRRSGPSVLVQPGGEQDGPPQEFFELVIRLVAELMGARVVSVMVPERGRDLIMRAACGLDTTVVRETRARSGVGVVGWVAEQCRPVCVTGPEQKGQVRGSGRKEYRSGTFLSVPLEGSGGLLGVLNVTDPVSPAPFDAQDCHLLLQLAERIAIAWDKVARGGTDAVETTVQALADLLRPLEEERGSSPDRAGVVRKVGHQLGLTESEVAVLSFAASLGEAGLAHAGRNPHEFDVPRTVRMNATESDSKSEGPPRPLHTLGVASDVLHSLHEWWDGSGYPRGLQGDEIPLGGRILAVVDAFERMIFGHGGRSVRSRKEAIEELERLSGRRFDPRVVMAFERALAAWDAENPPVPRAA